MKLLLPEVLHHLEKKPFVLCDAVGDVVVLEPSVKMRSKMTQPLMDDAQKAVKFLFDSGCDRARWRRNCCPSVCADNGHSDAPLSLCAYSAQS